jgi:hypothetical protein
MTEEPAPGPEQESSEPHQKDLPDRIDAIAQKYFTVWVWSIVVGIITTTTFSLINYRAGSRGSFLALLTAPLLAASCACALVAWLYIVEFIRGFIIPTFFYNESKYKAAAPRTLLNAVRWGVLSLIFRLALAVADLLLDAAG